MNFLQRAALVIKELKMNEQVLITDNITEVLVKIIEFTQNRQKVLIRNINNIHSSTFVPADLEVDEFADLLGSAVENHLRTGRLVLRDGMNIKFGAGGSFEAKPLPDEDARQLREANPDEYLQLQIDKLLENSLNQKLAAELLRQKQGTIFTYR